MIWSNRSELFITKAAKLFTPLPCARVHASREQFVSCHTLTSRENSLSQKYIVSTQEIETPGELSYPMTMALSHYLLREPKPTPPPPARSFGCSTACVRVCGDRCSSTPDVLRGIGPARVSVVGSVKLRGVAVPALFGGRAG